MKRNLLLLLGHFFISVAGLRAQMIYNQKNTTQNVYNLQYSSALPTRVMEYSTDQAGTILERRLETLPENGLPAMKVRTLNDLYEEIPYVNTPPFNSLFDNGLFGFQNCGDAGTLLFGTEVSLKIIQDKFGWSGIDNLGENGKPVVWNVVAPKTPAFNTSVNYSPEAKEFYYVTDGTEPEKILKIDAVCHEMVHAIMHTKIGSATLEGVDPCSERKVLEEALGDIIGLYVLNEYEQNSPAFYQWTWSQGTAYPGRPFENPNAINLPDTYYGNFFANSCPADGNYLKHKNATVVDHFYYLLAAGTTGTETNDLGYAYAFNGIGVNKAVQIVWKCIDYLSVKSTFADLKKATLTAAEQLYGLHSTEYLAVMDAWCAVGICDNNLGPFSMSPAHATNSVEPWPGVQVNVTWEGLPVDEWEVQMATNAAFTENVQNILIKNFSVVLKPGGGSAYSGFATGYYHPGQMVYARARITKASATFCKGYNPLCVLVQQYGPAHAFVLDEKKTKFWHTVPGDSWTLNSWNNPSVEWKSVTNTQQYTLQVADDAAFSKIIYSGTTPANGNFSVQGSINANLDPDKTYYTRVRAERLNSLSITDNFGAWSDTETIKTMVPRTSVIQALKQKPGDPASAVSSMGFWVNWQPYPGSTHYIVQVADDNAFANIVRTQTVQGNASAVEVLLPPVADQTNLFVRVLPQQGAAFGICDNVWRVRTDKNATVPLMKTPADGSAFPFQAFLGTFTWNGGTLNLNLVDHFEVHFTEKTSNLTSIFMTQGKVFDILLKDPLLYDDKQGFKVRVLAVNPLGAKSALSAPFNFTICPDHPGVSFPGDLGKVDPSKNFNIEWHPSAWFDPGSQFLVTIQDNGIPLPGFNNKPTTDNFMLVPAGTLTNGKSYTLTVRNSSACAGILVPSTFFHAIGAGGSNQPQPPKLVNFTIDLKGFRNDPDGTVIPPAWGTSNFVLDVKLIDPDGNILALVDPNGNQVTQLDVDSENSGILLKADNRPQGQYKVRLTLSKIFDLLLYYPLDQPRFSVSLNGQLVSNHVITIDPFDPDSAFNEWKEGFQFPDIIVEVK